VCECVQESAIRLDQVLPCATVKEREAFTSHYASPFAPLRVGDTWYWTVLQTWFYWGVYSQPAIHADGQAVQRGMGHKSNIGRYLQIASQMCASLPRLDFVSVTRNMFFLMFSQVLQARSACPYIDLSGSVPPHPPGALSRTSIIVGDLQASQVRSHDASLHVASLTDGDQQPHNTHCEAVATSFWDVGIDLEMELKAAKRRRRWEITDCVDM
jgi:hypothetical protein